MIGYGFSFTGSIGSPSCVAEATQWVLTREQVVKVRSQTCNEQSLFSIIFTDNVEIILTLVLSSGQGRKEEKKK